MKTVEILGKIIPVREVSSFKLTRFWAQLDKKLRDSLMSQALVISHLLEGDTTSPIMKDMKPDEGQTIAEMLEEQAKMIITGALTSARTDTDVQELFMRLATCLVDDKLDPITASFDDIANMLEKKELELDHIIFLGYHTLIQTHKLNALQSRVQEAKSFLAPRKA